jgi:hypothetical protein
MENTAAIIYQNLIKDYSESGMNTKSFAFAYRVSTITTRGGYDWSSRKCLPPESAGHDGTKGGSLVAPREGTFPMEQAGWGSVFRNNKRWRPRVSSA